MIIAIKQWTAKDWLGNDGFPVDTIYSTTVTVNEVPFCATFSHCTKDITMRAIQNNCRLVTVLSNKSTDIDTVDKLIVDAFQNNPALRYLVNRKEFHTHC